eukprot:g1256.t1
MRRLLCALVLLYSIPGLNHWTFAGCSLRAVKSPHRTALGAQAPSNLLRARSLPRLMYLMQGDRDLKKWNAVNLATAWHRLAKFSQEGSRGSSSGTSEKEPDERDMQASDDAYFLVQPSNAERQLLGPDLLQRRITAVRQARDQNRRFLEQVLEDLPDIFAGPDAAVPPARPVAEFRSLGNGVSTLPSSSYGSLASVFLHLMRAVGSE